MKTLSLTNLDAFTNSDGFYAIMKNYFSNQFSFGTHVHGVEKAPYFALKSHWKYGAFVETLLIYC